MERLGANAAVPILLPVAVGRDAAPVLGGLRVIASVGGFLLRSLTAGLQPPPRIRFIGAYGSDGTDQIWYG